MQDRFVGDIGDFGKYGLLRALTGIYPKAEPRLSLGVVWYSPGGQVGLDGAGTHRKYLDRPHQYRDCDTTLFDCLLDIRDGADYRLRAIEASSVLGDGTRFFGNDVPGTISSRVRWSAQALDSMVGIDVVFLDPDNGLAPNSAGASSVEHAYLAEVEPFLQRKQTVIIYHHLGRTFEGYGASHLEQMQGWATRLQAELPLDNKPEILWFRRGTARAYFVLPSERHYNTIERRLDHFRTGPWFGHRHFTKLLEG